MNKKNGSKDIVVNQLYLLFLLKILSEAPKRNGTIKTTFVTGMLDLSSVLSKVS